VSTQKVKYTALITFIICNSLLCWITGISIRHYRQGIDDRLEGMINVLWYLEKASSMYLFEMLAVGLTFSAVLFMMKKWFGAFWCTLAVGTLVWCLILSLGFAGASAQLIPIM